MCDYCLDSRGLSPALQGMVELDLLPRELVLIPFANQW